MRTLPIAFAILGLSTASACAEDMVDGNPSGIMCKDEKALADFAAPDGSAKKSAMADPFSATARRFMAACKDGLGATVHVVTKRKNTSIVTYNGETWYVPNINFFTPTPDCIKDGAKVTMIGKIETGTANADEDDPKKTYRYPRLALDKPVCFLGNIPEEHGRYVSLLGNGAGASTALLNMVGKRVTVSGTVESPDNGNQPPDPMMIFNPVVRPAE